MDAPNSYIDWGDENAGIKEDMAVYQRTEEESH
jgi:hypothetical protein